MKKETVSRPILAAGLIAAVLLAYLCFTTVYSSDDYWYSTFWKNGLSGYLELMDLHYQIMNGRVIVHVLAHIVLAWGNWAFVLLCSILCMLTPCAVACAAGLNCNRRITATVFFMMGILLVPRMILNQGVLWVSASCNYLFPSALVCLMVVGLERKRRWVLVAAFLCGATTEQMGLASVLLALAYTIDALVRKRGQLLCLGSTVMAALGVKTVFMSPATGERAASGLHLGGMEDILKTFQRSILKEASILTENPMPLLLMLGFLVLAGVLIWEKSGKYWPIVLCAVGCLALTAGSLGSEWVRVIGYTVGFLALAGLSVGLVVYGQRMIGALMLTALTSAAVMLLTNAVDPRVLLPFYFLLLLCVCLLGAGRYRLERHAASAAIAGTVVMVLCLLPTIKGYWYNYQVDQLNKSLAAEALETGCIRYCMDYDMDYTWIKIDHDPYFRQKYAESIGMPEHQNVVFFSRSDTHPHMIFFGEKPLPAGVAKDDEGRILFPMRQIVEHLGGSVEWVEGETTVTYGQREYILYDMDDQTMLVCWTDRDGSLRQELVAYREYLQIKYCEIALYEEILEIPIGYDEARFCYYITP